MHIRAPFGNGTNEFVAEFRSLIEAFLKQHKDPSWTVRLVPKGSVLVPLQSLILSVSAGSNIIWESAHMLILFVRSASRDSQ